MVAPIPTAPAQDADIFATQTWGPQIRNPMRELPSQKAVSAGQVFVGGGVREMQVLTPPAALSLLAFTGSVGFITGETLVEHLPTFDPSVFESTLQYPKITSANANQWLRVNAAGDGFELTGEPPWHR